MITLYFYGMILFEEKNKLKSFKKIIQFIIICIIHTLIFLYFEGGLKTILSSITGCAMLKIIFNENIGKSFFATLIHIILLIIPDLIVTISLSYILGKSFFYNNLPGSIISNIAVSIIMLIITMILKKPLRKIINYDISTNKKIILVSFFVLICLIIFFYNLINIFEFSNNIIGYLVVIFTLMIILSYLFRQKVENEAILKKYDDLLNIMKNYESDIEEQRIMIHETRNELMTIKCKITDDEKQTEIIDYIDSILGDKVSSKMSKYSKFKYLPSNGIKGFFYYKFMEAEKRGIKVSVNISKKIENSFLGKLDTKNFKDLVRIIGVYLDNAIEASSESKDKKIGIEIYLIKKDIDIIISNTFDNEINKEKIGKEKFSTKGKNRGHGLLLVRYILRKNKSLEITSTISKNIYTQKLRIKK